MQERVSIMCSWCGWENPTPRLRAATTYNPIYRMAATDNFVRYPKTVINHSHYLFDNVMIMLQNVNLGRMNRTLFCYVNAVQISVKMQSTVRK